MSPLPSIHRWRLVWVYTLRHHWVQIGIIVVGVLLYTWLRLSGASAAAALEHKPPPSSFVDWFDLMGSALSGLTFLVALFVWLGDVREDWEEGLPKLLNVYFFHNDDPVMVCRHAYLAGEGDIRQWGQQIGWQFLRQNLDFRPNLESRDPVLVCGPDGRAYKRFHVRFHLSRLPAEFEQKPGQTLWRDMMEGPLDAESRPVETVAEIMDVKAWRSAPASA